MEALERLRARRFSVPLVERLGLIRQILQSGEPTEKFEEVFFALPDPDFQETFGILLEYHVPELNALKTMLDARPPVPVAEPPSNEQIGYMRDPEHVWLHPRTASRDSLWDYLMLRWSYRYFDRILNIMLRTLSCEPTLALITENATSTMVLYHHNLLELLLPRLRLVLEVSDYCRDVHEYNELLQMIGFVLRSPQLTEEDLSQIPIEKLLYWGAGLHPHANTKALREAALHTLMMVSNNVMRARLTACLDPELIPSLCRILVDMPLDIHFVAIISLGYCNWLIDIQWADDSPYLFTMAIHVLLTATHTSTAFLLHAALSSHLLFRLAQQYPRRNIIEGCFYALTNILQQTQPGDTFRDLIEENIRHALTTNGNRSTFIELVGLQEPEQQELWSYLFPSIKWPAKRNTPILVDTLTEQPMVRSMHFEAHDSTPVSFETIIRHVATNGLRNPFTNLPLSWAQLVEQNSV